AFWPRKTCTDAWLRYGIVLGTCPHGKLRQTAHLEASGLRRGAKAVVTLSAGANFTLHDMDSVQRLPVTRFESITLTLVDAKYKAIPLPVEKWQTNPGSAYGTIDVPDVPDGDYQLHASFNTRIAPGELDVPIPLYTPARVHVITDRPLYEPGNLVHFRAVVLRARDLSPLDGRPGKWVVKDPNNEVLLEEKAPAGDFGIVAGTFPLDKAAETGTWHVAWVSADATDDVPITVQPFKLPRFRVDTMAGKPFYQAGDTPIVRGAVLYSSGAPVAHAKLDIQWEVSGDWPPPLDWVATKLQKKAETGANGRFELPLPQVPADLAGLTTITAHIAAVDAAGDRVEGAGSVLFSKDGILVSSVTELGDGLVQGFNNRMYVRVTTPDGRVLPGSKINVKRAWQANDNGIDATLDEDGVASLQLDPGAPVNVVIPAAPYRPQPKQALVTRGEPQELIGDEGAPLVDQEAMDKWLATLARCAKWYGVAGDSDSDNITGGGGNARVGLRVDAGGGIVAAGAGPSPLDQCVVSVLRQQRLPAGNERMYTVAFQFTDPGLPTLAASVETALDMPNGLAERIQDTAKGTRDCLPTQGSEGALPRALTWRSRLGSRDVELGGWIADPKGGAAGAAMPCVAARFAGRVRLAQAATSDSFGIVRFSMSLPEDGSGTPKPQPTTMLGYEMMVSADVEGKPSTKLRVSPGQIPNLRMRVKPVIAKPGDVIEAELIRGPEYGAGALPKELTLTCLKAKDKAKLDDDHKAKLTIDKAVEGWCEVNGGGVRALVYVRPQGELAVTLETKDKYKPGDQAHIAIQTTLGGKGGKAAVGLIGVDESLGQLVKLPGADDMGRIRPQVGTSTPAFGVLDGQALTLGRIRGANAAAATVLRVSSIPSAPELDAVVSASADSHFDPIEELTDHFYNVLAELHVQTRQWEAQAPQTEKMRPATMAMLWSKALAACEKRGEKIDDAYGRKLRLSGLPQDLLSLTDPRAVVVVGTRLPEDVENWAVWVAKERP
ncbi:MAG: hypothetical protein JWO36_5075, partial [Myxococcales bacterium]|nr:hypothetical protein [Myxococcales bacterium]